MLPSLHSILPPRSVFFTCQQLRQIVQSFEESSARAEAAFKVCVAPSNATPAPGHTLT